VCGNYIADGEGDAGGRRAAARHQAAVFSARLQARAVQLAGIRQLSAGGRRKPQRGSTGTRRQTFTYENESNKGSQTCYFDSPHWSTLENRTNWTWRNTWVYLP
jgi:hypothetical protein